MHARVLKFHIWIPHEKNIFVLSGKFILSEMYPFKKIRLIYCMIVRKMFQKLFDLESLNLVRCIDYLIFFNKFGKKFLELCPCANLGILNFVINISQKSFKLGS